jgi:hypothetical protein
MAMRRLLLAGGWLLGAAAVLLVLWYEATPPSRNDAATAIDGPTPYPSIVLYPTLVPTPAPDTEPHVLDLTSGRLTKPGVPAGFVRDGYIVRALLSDGSLLIESGQGPATVVVRADGTGAGVLPIPPQGQCEISIDNRYVAWIAGDHFQVYDAETAQISSVPPDAARFEGGLSDGGVIMGDSTGLCPAPPPSNHAGTGEETVIVDRQGNVTDRLPLSRWNVSVSPDAQRIAWVAGQGLHVYQRSTRAERVYPEVTFVTGEIVWSPDGAEIGYVRYTADDTVRVWVVKLVSGEQRAVYSAGPDTRIRRLAFTANDELRFGIAPLGSVAAQYDLPGARFVVADDGSGGRFLDDPRAPWSACGPSCGRPPAGYEDAKGLAIWCARTPAGGCIFHLVFVDRDSGAVRELAVGEFPMWSLSPDARQLAILLPAGSDQVLRLVQMDDFTSRDIPLGFTYANNVAWFPSGASLLLWSAGGN